MTLHSVERALLVALLLALTAAIVWLGAYVSTMTPDRIGR